jgi:hypothetical protein
MIRSRLLKLALCIFSFTLSVAAQEVPEFEIFGGYSYIKVNEGGAGTSYDLQTGWSASISPNLNRWFGLTADLSGHYETVGGAATKIHLFTFGPRFSIRRNDRFTPYFHVLAGGTRISTSFLGMQASDTGFAGIGGGGFDVHIDERFSVRMGQLDYVVTRFSGRYQHDIRYSAGVVFRFGSK